MLQKILDKTYTYVKYTTLELTIGKNIAECLEELAADISVKFTEKGKAVLGLTRKIKEVGSNGEVISGKNIVLRDSKDKKITAQINPNAKYEDISCVLDNFMHRCKVFFRQGRDKRGPSEVWRNYPTAQIPGHKIVPDTDNEKIISI